MMQAFMLRDEVASTHIRSTFYLDGLVLHIIERPWRRNQRNVSCIPAGKYLCRYMARSASGKYKKCWHLQEVPGRSGVLAHNGNLAKHSRGCLIVGKRRGKLAGNAAVLNSRGAMRALYNKVGPDDFELTIFGAQLV